MLKAVAVGAKKNERSDNPYLAARRVWNIHTGSLVSSLRLWQVVAVLALAVALGAVGGLIHVAKQPKFVPYLVHIDQLGQSVAQGPLPAVARNDPRIVRAAVADFVRRARIVTPDGTLQRNAVMRVYAFMAKNDPAWQRMTEWYQDDPLERAQREMVEVTVKSILQQSPETWQVDWVESTRSRQGALVHEEVLRALVTVYQADPTPDVTEEQMQRNPTGIYVRDFSWSRVL